MLRTLIARVVSAALDDRIVVAATTTMLLVVGSVLSLLLIALAALRAVAWLSGIRPRGVAVDRTLSW